MLIVALDDGLVEKEDGALRLTLALGEVETLGLGDALAVQLGGVALAITRTVTRASSVRPVISRATAVSV